MAKKVYKGKVCKDKYFEMKPSEEKLYDDKKTRKKLKKL